MKLATQTVVSSLVAFVVFVALVFFPAGTFDYWQGWLFIAILVVASAGPAIYLDVKNPAALERRMRGGPLAESRTPQKIASSGTLMSLPAAIVISAIDHRFGWSSVPEEISLIGDVLVVIGVGISFLVTIQNSYAAANITVEADQKVVSTGLYGLVRHPMYVGMLIFLAGTPLALGSYRGLIVLILGVIVFAFRILDEEKMLREELNGYIDYTGDVRYRLVPHVW
jgi:protein-S-isoprenylcysteine O-methyltransferase Ste14